MKTRPTDQDLSALADSMTRALEREVRKARKGDDDAAPPVDIRDQAEVIQTAVPERDFLKALDAMYDTTDRAPWLGLELAFPFMTDEQRAVCLREVWRRSEDRMPKVRLLRLFRGAPFLRNRVQAELPERVRVYRGAQKASRRQAEQRARNGLSWTKKRSMAVMYAKASIFALQRYLRPNQPPPPDTAAVGCVATATVPRDIILAYFHGEGFGIYQEYECILDPSTIKDIRFSSA